MLKFRLTLLPIQPGKCFFSGTNSEGLGDTERLAGLQVGALVKVLFADSSLHLHQVLGPSGVRYHTEEQENALSPDWMGSMVAP